MTNYLLSVKNKNEMSLFHDREWTSNIWTCHEKLLRREVPIRIQNILTYKKWKVQNRIDSSMRKRKIFPPQKKTEYRGSPDSTNFGLPGNRVIGKIVLIGDWFSSKMVKLANSIFKVHFFNIIYLFFSNKINA